MVPSGYPARTRLPGWPARLISAGARSIPGMRRTNRFWSIPGIPTSASTRCARIGTSGLPSMGSLLPRARHPCWFSKQACRRATTLIALASCSSISCIATRGPLARTADRLPVQRTACPYSGPLARTGAAPVIVGRCGCAVGGTSAAARWTAQPPQRCTPSPGPCPVNRPDYGGEVGLPHLGTRGIGTQLGQAVRMDRPIHHQVAASGLEADKIISRRGGRRSRPPRRRASSAGRRHPTRPGLPPNSHRTERSGHFGTDGQSSRISKYSAGRMWLLGTSGCAWRVTWRDRRGRLTMGFHLLGPRLAQPPGLSQTLEVPDDLHDPVRCPRPGSVRA